MENDQWPMSDTARETDDRMTRRQRGGPLRAKSLVIGHFPLAIFFA
jgi:hypothetical protein